MKTLSIKLYKSELLYDIQNKTYLTAINRNTGENVVQVADMQVNDDTEHKNQILRSVRTSYDLLLTKFGNHVSNYDKWTDNIQANDEVAEKTLTINLNLPDNFNGGALSAIASACHNFIVNTVVGDWFSIVKPDEAGPYITKATINLQEIREATYKRMIPTRKKSKDQWNTNH